MLVGYMRVSTDSDAKCRTCNATPLLAVGMDESHLFEDRWAVAGLTKAARPTGKPIIEKTCNIPIVMTMESVIMSFRCNK
jgi:hypothetical protein